MQKRECWLFKDKATSNPGFFHAEWSLRQGEEWQESKAASKENSILG